MSESHSLRVREERWKKIEKKAWALSQKADRLIKPTDIADAILWLYTDKITLEDVKNSKTARKSKT